MGAPGSSYYGKLLSTAEVAKKLGYNQGYINQLIKDGFLQAENLSRGTSPRYGIYPESVIAYQNRVSSRPKNVVQQVPGKKVEKPTIFAVSQEAKIKERKSQKEAELEMILTHQKKLLTELSNYFLVMAESLEETANLLYTYLEPDPKEV